MKMSKDEQIAMWADRNIYLRSLLTKCNEVFLSTGECPCCEMIWYDGWRHHIDCKLDDEFHEDGMEESRL